jgi:hypothetical protein
MPGNFLDDWIGNALPGRTGATAAVAGYGQIDLAKCIGGAIRNAPRAESILDLFVIDLRPARVDDA